MLLVFLLHELICSALSREDRAQARWRTFQWLCTVAHPWFCLVKGKRAIRRGLSFAASARVSAETPRARGRSWAARAMAWATGRRKTEADTGLQRKENAREEALFVGVSGVGLLLIALQDLVRSDPRVPHQCF